MTSSSAYGYIDGEPRNTNLRFDVVPAVDPERTILYSRIGFDILSLGWLVKTFLKHHPEIQFGGYPGSALSRADAIARSAEGR